MADAWTQNPVSARTCGFKSRLRYSKQEKDLRRLAVSPFSLMQCHPYANRMQIFRPRGPVMAGQHRRHAAARSNPAETAAGPVPPVAFPSHLTPGDLSRPP